MTVGKRKAIDRFRRERTLDDRYAQLGREGGAHEARSAAPPGTRGEFEDHIDDDVLRLMFVACHPILPVAARTALTLRLVGGLTTAEVARAYLEPEATVKQRILRAKRAIARAGVPFEVPGGDDRAARLGSVLEVIYLIFNEGYSATAGPDWTRPALCAEALRLGRVLAELAPDESEVHGLAALMEIQSSRLAARRGPDGEPVLLHLQDRRSWDRLLINRGLAALERVRALAGARGPYALQAAIAACHAVAFRVEDTDWPRVVTLYGELAEVAPSPIVELNRAVAVAMASGPQAGLDLVDRLGASGTLDGYHLLYGVRGDLLAKLGRSAEAAAEFRRAASLTGNERERRLLRARADALNGPPRTSGTGDRPPAGGQPG
jgi:predicted RNA polymerase sigma factor